MTYSKKMMLAWIAAGLVNCAAAARAEVIVNNDSGTIGTFSLTNNGGGQMTLNLDGTETLSSINGNVVGPFTANFDASVALTVSPVGPHEYSIVAGTLSAIFTDATAGHGQAILNYTLTGAETGTLLTDNAFLGGPILGIVANGFNGFDFSNLAGGNQNFALTSTHYTGGANSMESLFQDAGSSAQGSIAFSQAGPGNPALITPQPSTFIMAVSALISGVGLVAFRRWRVSSVK